MNLQEFLIYKESLIKGNPSLKDYSNHNLYSFFKDLPKVEGAVPEKVYRCHMVEDYLSMLSLPDELKQFTGASTGVRESLELLMKHLDSWIIPEDVYPFYNFTIKKPHSTYQTLGKKNLFENLSSGTLLVCAPLKPQGRDYTFEEISNLKKFLEKDPKNLLVIDLVYATNFYLPKEFLALYKTNQVILLHSLSKMFLTPKLFGISLLPQNSLGQTLRTLFQTLPKKEKELKQAYSLMKYNRHLPLEVKSWLITLGQKEGFTINPEYPSYLFYSCKSPEEFLKEGKIVIPATVFGGTTGSIISSLI